MLTILDVSNNNGMVNMAAIAQAGAAGVICKLCEGTSEIDTYAAQNWHSIRPAGMVRGAYQFVRPDTGDQPEAEAAHFLSVLGGDIAVGDIIALDIEVGSGDLSQWALRWLAAMEKGIGFKPIVYTGHWFAVGRLTDPNLGQYALWNSAYPYDPLLADQASAEWPAAYAPWSKVAIWQESDTQGWPGVTGPVDRSYFPGTVADLQLLGKPNPAPVPAPVPVLPDHGAYTVTTAHYLRQAPRLGAPYGAFLTTGEQVRAQKPANGAPARTTHWQYVQTAKDSLVGYAFVDNLRAA